MSVWERAAINMEELYEKSLVKVHFFKDYIELITLLVSLRNRYKSQFV